MSAAPSPLQVRNVRAQFGGVVALNDVSLETRPGAITGLIGPNGAGKTTLFNVVTGFVPPRAGSVILKGRDVTRMRTDRRARIGLGRTFQRLEVFSSLSVRDNILVSAESARRPFDFRWKSVVDVDALLERVGIGAVADVQADRLSTGTVRLVEVARALARHPDVLLLDEPSAGLDFEERERLGRVLMSLAEQEGLSILLVEHDVELVVRVCSHIYVLDFGRLIAAGTASEVQASEAVQEAYLGVQAVREHAGEVPVSARPLLELSGVSAGYGRITVLRGVSIAVPGRSIVALLGPNGAGKSTCMRVASGLIRPTAGDVHVDGQVVGRRTPTALARSGSCCIPEGRGIFPNLTVAENVRLWAYGARKPRAEVAERIYAQFPRLGERRKQMAGSLSGGEQQMLAISRALAADSKVLMLDEISMGIAPKLVAELYEVILGLVESQGLGVLVVEQFADSALAVADQAVVLIHGEVAMTGSPDDVRGALPSLYFQAGRGAAPAHA